MRRTRPLRQSAGQRLEVKSGTADHDRHAAERCRLGQYRGDVADPAAHRVILRRVDMAIEPMRRARLLFGRRPRGDDAQIAIDLHRVGIDHDAAEFFGEPQRQRRFSAGGRAGDEDGAGDRHDGVAVVEAKR